MNGNGNKKNRERLTANGRLIDGVGTELRTWSNSPKFDSFLFVGVSNPVMDGGKGSAMAVNIGGRALNLVGLLGIAMAMDENLARVLTAAAEAFRKDPAPFREQAAIYLLNNDYENE